MLVKCVFRYQQHELQSNNKIGVKSEIQFLTTEMNGLNMFKKMEENCISKKILICLQAKRTTGRSIQTETEDLNGNRSLVPILEVVDEDDDCMEKEFT